MDIETFREYCLSLSHTSEHLPFDEDTLVFKVGSKMFALCSISDFRSVNLKCDPERSVELRERYPGITAGYHMNKKHWNTVLTDGSVEYSLLLELTDHSYSLVFNTLTRAERNSLNGRSLITFSEQGDTNH